MAKCFATSIESEKQKAYAPPRLPLAPLDIRVSLLNDSHASRREVSHLYTQYTNLESALGWQFYVLQANVCNM